MAERKRKGPGAPSQRHKPSPELVARLRELGHGRFASIGRQLGGISGQTVGKYVKAALEGKGLTAAWNNRFVRVLGVGRYVVPGVSDVPELASEAFTSLMVLSRVEAGLKKVREIVPELKEAASGIVAAEETAAVAETNMLAAIERVGAHRKPEETH